MNTVATSNGEEHLKERAKESVVRAGESLSELDRGIRTFVMDRPLVSVLGALTVGYFVGRIIART